MLNIDAGLPKQGSLQSRRRVLSAGGAGLLGLSLPKIIHAEQLSSELLKTTQQPVRAKSVIFLFLFGGPSQLETFDLKPHAPAEIRGPYFPIASKTPRLKISEHLPGLASVSDKFAVIRSMSHDFNDHSGAAHYLQTGQKWHIPVGGGFSATPQDWPSVGSVTEYLAQHKSGLQQQDLPSYAVVPNWLGCLQDKGQYVRPGEYAGWLGQAYNPLTTSIPKQGIADNPYWRACSDEELNFELKGLAPEVSLQTIQRRTSLLDQFEEQQKQLDRSEGVAYSRFRERAMALMTSDKTRQALDIQQERPETRDRYGRHLFGQSCLMARRLTEAGVRFVTVHYDCVDGYSWDSHRNSDDVKRHLLPTFDQGCSALISDLDDRGLLEETLVVAIGEMGRTPKANATWGRNHWSNVFPAVIAGAGVQGGITYGASDRTASEVTDNKVSPEDLAATLYWAMGIDHELMLPDHLGRPIPINDGGNPVTALFG